MYPRRILMLGCFASLVLAAGADGPTARDRYFEAGRGNDAEWAGTRTSVVLRRGSRNNTTIREVGEGADFRSGDQFRIRLQTNVDGYAYLLLQNANGSYRLLYPAKDAKAGSNQVRAFQDRTLPGRSKEWLAFDNKPAIEGMRLIVSAKPVAELEEARSGSGVLTKSYGKPLN
jgi:hypothetical protein